MAGANHDLLREAIARNSAVVLSLPSAGMLRHHRSRFLAEALPEEMQGLPAEAAGGFWVEAVPAERLLVNELLGTGQAIAISFKSITQKVSLAAPLCRLDPAYRINAQTILEALLLPFPEHVKAVQRRSHYRVKLNSDAELTVRIWRIADRAYLGDRPMAAQMIATRLRDVSLGGLGVTFTGNDGAPPKVTIDDRLRIELTYKGVPLLLEGRMRKGPPAPDPSVWNVGVCFKALENNIEDRHKLAQLTKMIGELQREEVRRARLGLK